MLADIHYVVTGEFRREHRATIAGKLKFYENNQSGIESISYTLRRNIHRLEKGLIMQPRRSCFATAYIEETVDQFCRLNANTPKCSKQVSLDLDQTSSNLYQWAGSVLESYFDTVETDHPTIRQSLEKFRLAIKDEAGAIPTNCRPYQYRLTRHNITDEQFYKLCLQRRSVRWYEDRMIDPELIERAVQIASLSPSACNRQPFRFHIANSREAASRLGKIPMGTGGFHHQFPGLIVVVGDMSAYQHERDRHLIYIDGGLVSMSLVLALETLGINSCCINWPDHDIREKQMTNELGLSTYERPVMCISYGYAAENSGLPFSQKKSISQLVKYVD